MPTRFNGGYHHRVKASIVTLCLGLIFGSALASGPDAFFGFSPGLVQGEAGRTSISLGFGGDSIAGTIARGISGRFDLAATAERGEFDLEGRILALDIPPVGLLLTASFRGSAALIRLSLGPVRLDASRSWGRDGKRRLTLSAFPLERLFLLAGWEEGMGVYIGLRVNPGRNALFGISVLIGDRFSIGIGGAF